jgi:hypothetical protein
MVKLLSVKNSFNHPGFITGTYVKIYVSQIKGYAEIITITGSAAAARISIRVFPGADLFLYVEPRASANSHSLR